MRFEAIIRALADPTRLRIMRLLATMELAVGELAQVLGQSQPRVSRHIGILCDAGLAERHREGSWVFMRAAIGRRRGPALGEALARLLAIAEQEDAALAAACAKDRRQLATIRSSRERSAEGYFAQHADDWDTLRKLHSPDVQVECRLTQALAEAAGQMVLGKLLDIGTGTGRMAELFCDKAERVVALDKSLDMLRVARAKLQNLPSDRIDLVQGDFAALPFPADSFDTVLLHQVLHFAQDPSVALTEAARVTRPLGRIAIVDFAAHAQEELRERFAHARLGFTDGAMHTLLSEAGYIPDDPIALEGGQLVVKIWLGRRAGLPASRQTRKIAQ